MHLANVLSAVLSAVLAALVIAYSAIAVSIEVEVEVGCIKLKDAVTVQGTKLVSYRTVIR